jgi:class 3 adenylate cyclase/tetratricopeptide (TPR) repeat protein
MAIQCFASLDSRWFGLVRNDLVHDGCRHAGQETLDCGMDCQVCRAQMPDGARFCNECGARLPVLCPACGATNPPLARFCSACGGSLGFALSAPSAAAASTDPPSSAERRRVSVMFCDMVGSTELSARLDPEDLATVISTYQGNITTTIARFDGFVAHFVGDGVMVYFGWPRAGEADAEQAVRAALAVKEAVSGAPTRGETLRVRIGIATGLVVIGDWIGSGSAREQTAIGETPNRAARLQTLAEPNGVVIDAATRRQLGRSFDCRNLGPTTLKGLPGPVNIWAVQSEGAVKNRLGALNPTTLTPMVDRHEEVDLLLSRWRQATAGQGQLVLLAGEPGIGKSRLVMELRARLRGEPHVTLRYFCSPYHQASPLYPIIARWERDAGFVRSDGPMDKLRKLEAVLLATGASAEDISLIADLLEVPMDGSYPQLDLSPQRKKHRTFEFLTRRAATLARERPLVLFAEDLHWADPSSLELLDRMIGLLSDLPILLIVSFRPEFAAPWVGHANATLVTLSRLNRRDAMQLATEVVIGRALRPALLEQIVIQSDGVPLFIEELTTSVLETAEGQAVSLPLLTVPVTLQGLLMARLDRLPAAKRVAQIGATIGREFSLSLLAAVAEIPEKELVDGLDELVGSGLASGRGELTDTVYTFKHALVQEAIYDNLLRRRRAEIHARIVAEAESDASLGVTEPGLLGYHCAQAGLLAKAASYYRIAGGRSAERAAVAETRIYLERGLQFAGNLPDDPDRHRLEAELLIALGRILMVTKGPSDADAGMAFRRAVAVCRKLDSPEMLARALYSLGIIAEARAELVEGQAIGEQLRALAEQSGDAGIAIAAHVRLGLLGYYRGQFAAGRDHLAEALALSATGTPELRDSAIASDPHVAAAYLSVTLAHLGYAEQAISRGQSAVEGARRSGSSSPAYALVLTVWSRTLEVLRDEAGCSACAAMLVSICEEQGFSFLLAIGQCQLGWVSAKQGDISKGLALLSEGVASLKTLGSRVRPEVGKYLLSDVLALSGRRAEALAMLEEVLEFSRATSACWLDAELHRKKGELLLARTDTDAAQAEQEFRQAIDIARNQAARLFELRAVTSLARLWSVRGRRAEALELLRPIHDWFSEGADIPDVQEARALLVDLDATPSSA